MKSKRLIIYFFNYILMHKTVIAQNHSNCCLDWEVLRRIDHDNTINCFNTETKTITNTTLQCFNNFGVFSYDKLPYKLNNDGSLSIVMGEMLEEVVSVQKGEFCLGNRTEDNQGNPKLLLCLDDIEPEVVSLEVLGYSMGVSSIFFALTAIVYQALPELRDLEGKSIVSLCSAQAIGYGLLCFLIVMGHEATTWCTIRGFLTYYFLESSFFWMNALAVQIFIAVKYSSTCNDAWKKFKWYSIYAWGTPAVLTLIVIVVNYLPGSHKRPGIGYLGNCWFLDLQRLWIYFYSVLTIIMTVNLGIFVYVCIFTWKYKFSSSALKYKFYIMFRLFIVTGLPSIYDMISSSVSSHVIWAILDIIYCLGGISVFLILVVLRRRVLKSLRNRNVLYCLSGLAAKYLDRNDDEEMIVSLNVSHVHMEERGVNDAI